MKDNTGSLYIIDAILMIIVILIASLMLNVVINAEYPSLTHESLDYNQAQDIMEILDGKVNFSEKTFIGEISSILIDNKNSKQSVNDVCDICKSKFKDMKLKNYCFKENNKLNGKVLASSGDVTKAGNVSVATRSYGEYFYTLYIW